MKAHPEGTGPDDLIRWISRLSKSPRPAGSAEGVRACSYFRGVLESTGRFDVEEGQFEFQRYSPWEWSFKVDGSEVDCAFALCSASTPRGGVQGELRRFDQEDLEGKIALLPIRNIHESVAVEDLAQRGALAVVAFQEWGPTVVGRVAYPKSTIPCLTVSAGVGASLWSKESAKRQEAQVVVRARTVSARGSNLFATPKRAGVQTLFTAHRDSRPLSPGAIDNASGSALLLFLAHMTSAPRFSLLSTDAEEYGLRGARAFVGAGGVVKGTDIVNLDSIGSGPLHLIERSRGGLLSPLLNSKMDEAAAKAGVSLSRTTTSRGSDSDVFKEAGHRACWVRSYPTPTATTLEDTVSHVRKAVLGQCSRLLRSFVGA